MLSPIQFDNRFSLQSDFTTINLLVYLVYFTYNKKIPVHWSQKRNVLYATYVLRPSEDVILIELCTWLWKYKNAVKISGYTNIEIMIQLNLPLKITE